MPKEEMIEIQGKVVQVLPHTIFRVQLETGQKIVAHLSGKLRIHHIRVLQGDKVLVELSPYDLTRGRITYRMKQEAA